MAIFIGLASILSVTAIVSYLNKKLPVRFCPLCTGVAFTWLWMVGGAVSNILSYEYLITAGILMGGSVVGIAYMAEKNLPSGKSKIGWLTSFVLTGFGAVYGVVFLNVWLILLFFASIMAVVGFFFYTKKIGKGRKKRIEKIEKELEDCC